MAPLLRRPSFTTRQDRPAKKYTRLHHLSAARARGSGVTVPPCAPFLGCRCPHPEVTHGNNDGPIKTCARLRAFSLIKPLYPLPRPRSRPTLGRYGLTLVYRNNLIKEPLKSVQR